MVGEEECSFVVKYHGKREKFPYCFSDPRNVITNLLRVTSQYLGSSESLEDEKLFE